MLVPSKPAITLTNIKVRKPTLEIEATAPEKGNTISLEIGKHAYSIAIMINIASKPYLNIKFVNTFTASQYFLLK